MEEVRDSPTKKEMLTYIQNAYDLIKDNLDAHEKRGIYLFHVMKCRIPDDQGRNEYFGIGSTEEYKMGP
jgi:hypothetical protein